MKVRFVALGARVAVLAVTGAAVVACTTTSVQERSTNATVSDLRMSPSVVEIEENALSADRVQRLRDFGTPAALQTELNRYLEEGGLLGGELNLAIGINALRLPLNARSLTAQFKGNDFLGARVVVSSGSSSLYAADVTAQLGAGERSLAENRSGYRAHESLVGMLAWEIAWALSEVFGGRGEEKILEAGKRDLIKHAILVLAHRGRLSYAEFLKYAAQGKVGLEPDLSVRYDACTARKLLTLGLSKCEWDPDYR